MVAEHANTPVPVLETLARNGNERIRRGAARNKNTPVAVLESLMRDPSASVRGEVSWNANLPVSSLRILAWDEDEKVRENVAGNPRTPLDLLERLSKDNNKVVYGVVRNSNAPLALLETMMGYEDYGIRGDLAHNPNTSLAMLETLANDESGFVREKVASNPRTPADLLKRLAEDPDKTIRRSVVSSPNAPVDLLKKLAEDPDKWTRRRAAERLTELKVDVPFASTPEPPDTESVGATNPTGKDLETNSAEAEDFHTDFAGDTPPAQKMEETPPEELADPEGPGIRLTFKKLSLPAKEALAEAEATGWQAQPMPEAETGIPAEAPAWLDTLAALSRQNPEFRLLCLKRNEELLTVVTQLVRRIHPPVAERILAQDNGRRLRFTLEDAVYELVLPDPDYDAMAGVGTLNHFLASLRHPQRVFVIDTRVNRVFACADRESFPEVARRCGVAAVLPQPPSASKSLSNLYRYGGFLFNWRHPEAAIAVFDYIIEAYERGEIAELAAQVDQMERGDREGRIAVTKKTIDIQEVTARALFEQGHCFMQLRQTTKGLAIYEAVAKRFGKNETLREIVSQALNNLGYHLLLDAKARWKHPAAAREALQKARNLLEEALQKNRDALIAGNLAYVAWLLGETEMAETTLRAALDSAGSSGASFYKATLSDIATTPIPPDAGFRDLLERLWREKRR
jgi:hypothetical protein